MTTLLLAAVLSAGGQPCVAPGTVTRKTRKKKRQWQNCTRGRNNDKDKDNDGRGEGVLSESQWVRFFFSETWSQVRARASQRNETETYALSWVGHAVVPRR